MFLCPSPHPVRREVAVDVAFTLSSSGGLRGSSSPTKSVLCYSVNHSGRLTPSEKVPALTDAGTFVGSC